MESGGFFYRRQGKLQKLATQKGSAVFTSSQQPTVSMFMTSCIAGFMPAGLLIWSSSFTFNSIPEVSSDIELASLLICMFQFSEIGAIFLHTK